MSKKISFFLLFVCAIVTSTFAQSVDEIIEKHIEALGGMEKLQAINTLKMSGTMVMGAMGIEGQFTRQMKRPHFVRMDIGFQGQNMVQAYDGENAWGIVPFMGDPSPQPLPEEQAKQLRQDADFDGPLVDYKSKGHEIQLVGKEDLEGTDTYKLKIILKDGDVLYLFLDAEYYLELKRISKQKDRRSGNEIEVETYFSDFKEVNGVMMPHALQIAGAGPGGINIAINAVEANVDIDDSTFKMPAKSTEEGDHD